MLIYLFGSMHQQQTNDDELTINIKYISRRMEEQLSLWPITTLIQPIINSNHLNIMQTLISFLGPPEIEAIANTAISSQKTQFFYKVAIAQHFLNRFINKVDRTNYYLFYEDPEFKSIERQHLMYLVKQHYETLIHHYQSFTKLEGALKNQTAATQGHEELNSIINGIFFQTDLSLPKMKRQTIGMYCQSPLQEYLSLLKFPEQDLEEQWVEQSIIQLQQQIASEVQQLMMHFPYHQSPIQHPSSPAHEKIKMLRYSGFKIRHDNWEDFLIEGFRLHNIIVVIFGLCSQLVTSFSFIIGQLEDPFLKFTEFTLRANIYRNFILNLNEKFEFLFERYSQFYENVYSAPLDRPPFKFWRPALSIWIQEMKKYHQANRNVYNYVGSKIRQTNLLQFLQIKTEKLPSFFSNLKDQVSMHIFSESRKEEVYNENESKMELEFFFENNEELYEILAKDYLQYMVDISINEFSVHKCGHSRHSISNPLFQQFQESIVSQTSLFYQFIKQILYGSAPQQLRLGFFREVVKEDLNLLNCKLVKPVTLNQIISLMNDSIRLQISNMPQFAVFGEEGMAKYKLNWEFQQKDALLDYFCTKYHIGECPQKLQYYHNIQSGDAGEEEGSDCEEQSFQYCQEYISEGEMEDD